MTSVNNNSILNSSQMQLSFAGCGFLCIYHAGVCAAIKEYAPQLTHNKIKGASAGAIAAAGLVCNVCMSHATNTILKIVSEARAGSLLALSPNFDVLALVRQGLEDALPENAHILCTGRLFISATRAKDYKNEIISEFSTRKELIEAILCSCFIPFYCGTTPPTYRGEQYIDGAFSDNQPGKWEQGTITVSPFSGESDICPTDEDSASMFGFDVAGTSVQFTTQNLFRSIVILFPPAPEVCSRICRQGFEDALRFLTKNHLVPCIECLTIQSNAIPISSSSKQNNLLNKKSTIPLLATEPFLKNNNRIRILQQQKKRSGLSNCISNLIKSNNNNNNDGCERCLGPLSNRFASSHFASIPLPSVVQKSLTDMEKRSSAGFLSWLRRWRLIRWWLRLILPPIMLPFELLQFVLRKLRIRIAKSILAPAEAFLLRFQYLIDFIIQQIENKYFVPSEVIPIGSPSLIKITEPSSQQQQQKYDRKISLSSQQRKISSSIEPLDLAIENYKINKNDQEEEENETERLPRHVILKKLINNNEIDNNNDAIFSFHYREDETNELKICQIFDTSSGRQQKKKHYHNGIICSPSSNINNYEDSFEIEEHNEGEEGGDDSGLSLAEDEICDNNLNKKKKQQVYLKKKK